jgi:hypothetical protein
MVRKNYNFIISHQESKYAMKLKKTVILSILSIAIISCAGPKSVSKNGKHSNQFSLAKVDSIKNYLSAISDKPVNDTVIIKYDFNYDAAGTLLISRLTTTSPKLSYLQMILFRNIKLHTQALPYIRLRRVVKTLTNLYFGITKFLRMAAT